MNNISVLYSEEELALSVKKLGAEITEEYKGKKLLVVCVLKGAFVFTADHCKKYRQRYADLLLLLQRVMLAQAQQEMFQFQEIMILWVLT